MLASLSFVLLAAVASATPCESLRSLSIPQATIVTADVVQAGPFVEPSGGGARQGSSPQPAAQIPKHCRVTMVLKPSSDSKIGAELWMPTENWNGKLLVVGNGGFAGAIQGEGGMQIALGLGYANDAT